jgi:phospholipid transport system substrate-binding protein
MESIMKKIIPLILSLSLLFVTKAYGEEPLDVLKTAVDQVISILEDSTYKGKSELQHEALWNIMEKIFDFNMMSRRTLANNWKSFTPQEQKEFSGVFGRFLGDNYLNKIQSEFSGEKVEYLGQEMITGKKALVMTKILRKSVQTPIDYGMFLRNGKWKIYDVKIEGVSLLKNYRSQFIDILIKETPRQLIDRLKEKLNKYDSSTN